MIMKKILVLFLAVGCLLTVGCNPPPSPPLQKKDSIEVISKEKACEYVRSKLFYSDEEIAEISVIHTDSAIGSMLELRELENLRKATFNYQSKLVSEKDLLKELEKAELLLKDILDSRTNGTVRDSLARLDKYKNAWQEIHSVQLVKTDGDTLIHRVVMFYREQVDCFFTDWHPEKILVDDIKRAKDFIDVSHESERVGLEGYGLKSDM
jgi:hypothetical protein